MPAGSPGAWYGAAKTGPECSGLPASGLVSVERMILVASRMYSPSSEFQSYCHSSAKRRNPLALLMRREVFPSAGFEWVSLSIGLLQGEQRSGRPLLRETTDSGDADS